MNRHRAGEVDDERNARLERADEQRLAVAVVAGDLGPERANARVDLRRIQVDLADAGVELSQEALRRP
jgi:hypothetical protein